MLEYLTMLDKEPRPGITWCEWLYQNKSQAEAVLFVDHECATFPKLSCDYMKDDTNYYISDL